LRANLASWQSSPTPSHNRKRQEAEMSDQTTTRTDGEEPTARSDGTAIRPFRLDAPEKGVGH
jgi:hypothetical protein